jgi:hypothetical protein
LIFAYRGHLQALKVCDLKLLCLSQLCGLKDKSKSDFKMKNMIGDGMKTFRKYRRLAINTEFLLAFYKSNSQM